jgi:type II secretory pathway pseudopilin PulG
MTLLLHTRRRGSQEGERGYILLSLLLIIALGIIFAAAIVPSLTFNIKRDREEEMIHRGVQYSRAIRAYYKKFGRYPTKLEDLENTNNLRFLRRRYKDPLTGQDFKLLHFGEVQLSLSGISGGSIPGASPIGGSPGALAGGPAGSGGFSQPSNFGGNGGAFGANSGGGFGSSGGGFGGNSSFGANSNSSFGQNQGGQNQQSNGTSTTGTDPSQAGSQTNPSSTPSPDGTGDGTSATNSGSNGNGSNQIGSGQIIGGPIVGVASISKDKTIREYNHKTKYKDWVFVYDPAMDRGGIITTPYQPQLMAFGQQGTPNLNGQSGSNGTTGTGFGNSSSFGSGNSGNSFGSSPSGMQNSPNGGAGGGFSTPNPPPSNPPQ